MKKERGGTGLNKKELWMFGYKICDALHQHWCFHREKCFCKSDYNADMASMLESRKVNG